MNDKEKRLVELVLTVFFGWTGYKQFKDKKIVLGFIWLFTLGLFLVGWIIDIFSAWKQYSIECDIHSAYKEKSLTKYTLIIVGTAMLIFGVFHEKSDSSDSVKTATEDTTDSVVEIVDDKTESKTTTTENEDLVIEKTESEETVSVTKSTVSSTITTATSNSSTAKTTTLETKDSKSTTTKSKSNTTAKKTTVKTTSTSKPISHSTTKTTTASKAATTTTSKSKTTTTIKKSETTNSTSGATNSAYLLNPESMKIHYSDCRTIKHFENFIPTNDFQGALSEGYTTCGVCFR